MKKIDLSFVVAFYNEEKNIFNICSEISKIKSLIPGISFEIILVNDGSIDNSWEIAKEIIKDSENSIIGINFCRNFGAISALMAGIKQSNGKYIVDVAADGQEPIELFAELYNKNISEQLDISWGVRESRKDPLVSKMFSKFHAQLMRKFAIPNYPTEGLDAFCISRKLGFFLLDNYNSTSNLHNLLFWVGNKHQKVAYKRLERNEGKSKWTLKKKINLFVNSFVSFSYTPLRFVTLIGFLLALIGLFLGVYITYYKIHYGFPIEGWASITAILFFGFGVTNLSLGIISEYIWRISENINPKPLYIIDEVITKSGSNEIHE